jgi:hypothetical protein
VLNFSVRLRGSEEILSKTLFEGGWSPFIKGIEGKLTITGRAIT